jgi:hypothetical protein
LESHRPQFGGSVPQLERMNAETSLRELAERTQHLTRSFSASYARSNLSTRLVKFISLGRIAPAAFIKLLPGTIRLLSPNDRKSSAVKPKSNGSESISSGSFFYFI